MLWIVAGHQTYWENTAEYGFGDYQDRIPYMIGVVEADTERKAQNAAKKFWPRVKFSGMFGQRLIRADDEAAAIYRKYPDRRLKHANAELHYEALSVLNPELGAFHGEEA